MANPNMQRGAPSVNPKGRPKKERALTAILERAGSATLDVDGKAVSGKRLIARMAWEAATTGVVTFPDGKKLTVAANDWFDVLKWLYVHIDGPAKTTADVNVQGGLALVVAEELVDANSEDSASPGATCISA